ncbi:MAG: helix-turn-helix transcriptional regulator [Actinomycetota bacterium]
MRRIERLINLVAALLDARRPMTADEIKEKIAGYDQDNREAFRRTFERDKQDLREMGIPIEVVATDPLADAADGYIIPKARYYLPQIDLEPDELAALKIAADAVLGAGEEAEAGFLKLSFDAETTPMAGPQLIAGADVAAGMPPLSVLYEAWAERRPVSFEYRPVSGEVDARTVEPYGLLQRRGHWYVVGRDQARHDIRSFKVSRIVSAIELLDGSFEPPDDLDLSSHMQTEAWEIGSEEPATAVVRFAADIRWWAEQNMDRLPSREAPAGALELDLPVANDDALLSWVIGFGDSVEIVSPERLRRRLVEHIGPFLRGRKPA